MSSLDNTRKSIDRIDSEMAELFIKRMKAAEEVADYKKTNGLPIEDKTREAAMIAKNAETVPAAYRPYYINFLNSLITESKRYQSLILRKMTVAYSGVEGAFAHIASRRIFPDAEKIACPDFETAYRMVENGTYNCAVLPIENSYAGDVGRVMDLAYSGKLSIAGIYDMPLKQSLLAKPGTSKSDIRAVKSHPQALTQCMPYLLKTGWQLIPAENTAVSAKEISESGDNSTAVIGAVEAAELYGLEVLEAQINQQQTNTTRFAVFTAAPAKISPNDGHFSIMFNCKNIPGALGKAISIISKYDFNLKCLKSHPTGIENWEYYFYAEGEGSLWSENGSAMLAGLREICNVVKLLGSFEKEVSLEKHGG
ncbi:MAG: chorismate mutase [Clostridia bacterium]|nr:chorismate mutase [Clostridia bacterium]